MISSFSQEQFQQFYEFSGGGGGKYQHIHFKLDIKNLDAFKKNYL